MKKMIQFVLLVALTVLVVGCNSLHKKDLINLDDKTFYITKVTLSEPIETGLSFKIPSKKEYTYQKLPITEISKILSQQLFIIVDNDEFQKANRTSETTWKSNKENINTITINCYLDQRKTGLNFSMFITLTTKDGSSSMIGINSPDRPNQIYDVEKIAKTKGITVDKARDFIIDEILKSLPSKLYIKLKDFR